ncbi:putative holin-like toxin [Metabacillus sp. HB246100]
MTIYESLIVMFTFASLIIAILTFTQKK